MKNIIFRRSKRGVPHTLFEIDGQQYSICWFGKNHFYRVFKYLSNESHLFDIYLSAGEEITQEQLEIKIKQLDY
jgi:TRAP-type C4-dicarboxylate transport system substrate-binding protein